MSLVSRDSSTADRWRLGKENVLLYLLLASCCKMADKEKKPFERLPTDVVPRNYKLELKPDLKALTFEGKLEITCEASCYRKISRVPYRRGGICVQVCHHSSW